MPSKERFAGADFRLTFTGAAAPPRKSSGLAEPRSRVNCSPRHVPVAVALARLFSASQPIFLQGR